MRPQSMSPSASPPSLLSSSSASHPSTSTQPHSPPFSSQPQTQTPARPRGRARYAELSRDPSRVPLHRRGTSKTYERLEDLLREAGYKDVRVFTPEAERVVEQATDQRAREREERGQARSGVASFLAGLGLGGGKGKEQAERRAEWSSSPSQFALPDRTTGKGRDQAEGRREWSSPPSPSPLANRSAKHDRVADLRLQFSPIEQPRPRPPKFTVSPEAGSRSTSTSSHEREHERARRRHAKQHPHHHHQKLRPQSSFDPSMRPHFSRAGTGAAAGQSDVSSPAHAYLRHMASTPNINILRPHSAAPTLQRRGRAREQEHPPMPAGWLETVARAVLGIASASTPTSPTAPAAQPLPLVPGKSMAHLQPSQVVLAPGVVVATHVVCRSAPVSRSASRTRVTDDGTVRGKGKARAKGRGDGGPSLCGRVEDGWAADEEGEGEEEGSVGSDDEEEGELDLAKMLVHPKRQMSIQSLRKHLRPTSVHTVNSGATRSVGRAVGTGRRKWVEGEGEGEVQGDTGEGEGTEGDWNGGTVRRRRGLPRAWTEWGR